MRTKIADATGIKTENKQNNQSWNIPGNIPMNKSIFTIAQETHGKTFS